MPPRKLLIILGLACATAGGPAAQAGAAAAAPEYALYTYKVTLKGVQKSTWSMDSKGDGPCNGPSVGSGRETIRFRSKPKRIKAFEGVDPLILLAGGYGPPALRLRGTVERYGDIVHFDDPGETIPCGSGGGDPGPVTPPDCGVKQFDDVIYEPTFEHTYGKDRVILEQRDTAEDALGYEACPIAGAAGFPFLLQYDDKERRIGAHLPARDLFRYGKNIVIGKGRNRLDTGEIQSDVSIRWELTFKRIRRETSYDAIRDGR